MFVELISLAAKSRATSKRAFCWLFKLKSIIQVILFFSLFLFFLDASDILGQLLLLLQVALTGDHDPLRLRRSCAMHRFRPVTDGRRAHGQVFVLDHFHEFDESFMILGAQFLVHFVGGAVDGVHGVHAYAPLEAGCGLLAQKALHFDFFDQIVGALMQVGESVDFVPRKMGCGCHEVFMLGFLGQGIGHFDGVQGWTDDGVVHPVIHEFPHEVDLEVHLTHALFVLLWRLKGHVCFLLKKIFLLIIQPTEISFEIRSEVWMSNVDEFFCSSLNRFPH